MLLKGLLKKIDQWLCNYLNIEKEYVQPNTTQIDQQKLVITHTLPFKRHGLKLPWNQFKSASFDHLSTVNQKKLGMAIGKSIAKGLVVSFDSLSVEKPSHEK